MSAAQRDDFDGLGLSSRDSDCSSHNSEAFVAHDAMPDADLDADAVITGDPFVTVGLDPPFTVLDGSDSWFDMTGFKRQQIVGRTMRMLQGPATDLELLKSLIASSKQGEGKQALLTVYLSSGEEFLCGVSATKAKMHDGRDACTLYMHYSDATTSKTAHTDDDNRAKVVVSIAAGQIVEYVSPQWCTMFSFLEQQVRGRSITLIHGPKTDRVVWAKLLKGACRGISRGAKMIMSDSQCNEISCDVLSVPVMAELGGSVNKMMICFSTDEGELSRTSSWEVAGAPAFGRRTSQPELRTTSAAGMSTASTSSSTSTQGGGKARSSPDMIIDRHPISHAGSNNHQDHRKMGTIDRTTMRHLAAMQKRTRSAQSLLPPATSGVVSNGGQVESGPPSPFVEPGRLSRMEEELHEGSFKSSQDSAPNVPQEGSFVVTRSTSDGILNEDSFANRDRQSRSRRGSGASSSNASSAPAKPQSLMAKVAALMQDSTISPKERFDRIQALRTAAAEEAAARASESPSKEGGTDIGQASTRTSPTRVREAHEGVQANTNTGQHMHVAPGRGSASRTSPSRLSPPRRMASPLRSAASPLRARVGALVPDPFFSVDHVLKEIEHLPASRVASSPLRGTPLGSPVAGMVRNVSACILAEGEERGRVTPMGSMNRLTAQTRLGEEGGGRLTPSGSMLRVCSAQRLAEEGDRVEREAAAVQAALERCRDDRGLLLEIAQHLISCTIPEHLEDVRRALKSKNCFKVYHSACMLIDSGETIGAAMLVERASPLAFRAKEGILDGAENDIALIKFEFDRVSKFWETFEA